MADEEEAAHLRTLLRSTTNWDPDKDLVAAMRETFGAVEVHRFNAGRIFIAVASRPGSLDAS